jgi:hypothetical protein
VAWDQAFPCSLVISGTGIRLLGTDAAARPDPGGTVVATLSGGFLTANAPGFPGTVAAPAFS